MLVVMSSAAHFASPVLYVECDVPDGMTLREWRSIRHQDATPHQPVGNLLRHVQRASRRRSRTSAS
jgi:hypothetical protein